MSPDLRVALRVLRDVSFQVCVSTGCHVPQRELRSCGAVALAVALQQYEPERGIPLAPYLAQRVRWALLDEVRRQLGRDEHGRVARRTVRLKTATSDAPSQDALYESAEERVRLLAAVRSLPRKERLIVERYYLDERGDFQGIARGMRLSKSWVSRLHDKALQRLRRSLEAA